jgi:hypothetical protein
LDNAGYIISTILSKCFVVASVPHCQLKHCHWLTRFESSVARLV